jgi:DNA-binding NtrC family response regulator
MSLNDLSDEPDTTLLLENIDRFNEAHVTALQNWLAQAPRLNSRLVSTTTQNLSDLSLGRGIKYAVSTVEVEMPPLRERGDDVVQLAEHFARVTCHQYGYPTKSLSLEAKAILLSHPWQDNIHALRHLLERTIIMLDGNLISAGDLALEPDDNAPKAPAKPNLAASEKAMIEEALKIHNFNVTATANQLGLKRTALYRRMSKYGL